MKHRPRSDCPRCTTGKATVDCPYNLCPRCCAARSPNEPCSVSYHKKVRSSLVQKTSTSHQRVTYEPTSVSDEHATTSNTTQLASLLAEPQNASVQHNVSDQAHLEGLAAPIPGVQPAEAIREEPERREVCTSCPILLIIMLMI